MSDNYKILYESNLAIQAARNAAAFSTLYRLHYDGVFRYCVHRLFNRAVAEDVTSTIFLKVVENLPRFRGDDKAFRCWLYKIATNTINSYLRGKLKQKKLFQNLKEQASEYSKDDSDETGDNPGKPAFLQKAMHSLKSRHQTVITLRFFENMDYTEIARIVGASEATVRSQVSRALDKLRKIIAALEKQSSISEVTYHE
ncbi:MAG: RNA polymerase sigma factor [Sedimentisphaerales bacterium]|nr:RNA polymerase sigma factor [Sedimentisphaerales bacterium]